MGQLLDSSALKKRKALKRYEVLLVDDSPDILRVFGWALKDRGYRVTKAAGGAEAIDRLSAQHFDLMISDLMMYPIDGIAVLKEAKARNPEIKVIIFTAHNDLLATINARPLGADDYLSKQSGLSEILGRISGCLKRPAGKRCVSRTG
jgi:DNA-binding response OmpR family regulator